MNVLRYFMILNYIFVDRSIALVIRNGDFKVKGSHDSSPPISVDLSLLVTAVEKLHLSNTILYMKYRETPQQVHVCNAKKLCNLWSGFCLG